MPAMLNFSGGSSPVKKVLEITSFAGIDLSSAPADIDIKRSPDAINMMPDSKGNPIKRPGFEFVRNLPGRINGSFALGDKRIIHAGDALFVDGEKIWDGMTDEISSGQVLKDKLYIFDGFEALVFDGNDVSPLTEKAYIPTVLISKNADECTRETVLKGNGMSTKFILDHKPTEIYSLTVNGASAEYSISGEEITFSTAPEDNAEIILNARYVNEPGGSAKEEFNLISRRWKESFLCDTGTEKAFTLSQKNLSEETVLISVRDDKGNWQQKTEGTDFSVDRENGKVLFNEPVLKAPVTGEDNVIIEAAKYFDGYENKINHCSKSICYNTNGTSDRIFICGNKEETNRDFWCAAGDPTYWPDTYYSDLCNDASEIVGYSIIEGYLGAHISPALDGRSVVLRGSSVDELGNASFPIVKHLQGEEACSPESFVYMEKEPLFITKRGVYAITAEDVSGEKYTQNRSYFINKVLCDEERLRDAFCMKWKQFYIISLSEAEKIYLLDTSQRSYQRGEPLSSFQYECYLWTGIPARVLWEEEGQIFFGDKEGNICCFKKDLAAVQTYVDYSKDGEKAIEAYWTFPDFLGDTFWKNKTIRTVAIQLAPFVQNKVVLEKRIGGIWENLKTWAAKISYFSWSGMDWAEFTWSRDFTYRTITAKVKIKKFDKVGFKVSCTDKYKAFGLYGFSVEYSENGRFKK